MYMTDVARFEVYSCQWVMKIPGFEWTNMTDLSFGVFQRVFFYGKDEEIDWIVYVCYREKLTKIVIGYKKPLFLGVLYIWDSIWV